jgi:flavin-dependent dehydrogenase
LAPLGVDVPETTIDTGAVYFSRFYRCDMEAEFGFRGGVGRGLVTGVIGADAGTYSVTAVVDKDDKELRAHLNDSERFDATMRILPELADVADVGGVPMQPVHCMTGLVNRLRRFTRSDGDPLVVGLMACGDAHTCTNPAYGRGQSLALLQATMIADALAGTDDLRSAGRRYEKWSSERVEPWYHFSVMTDGMRTNRPKKDKRDVPTGYDSTGLDFAALMANIANDPEAVHTMMRVMNLLEPPSAIFELLQRAGQAAAESPPTPIPVAPRPPRPSRDELLAVVA